MDSMGDARGTLQSQVVEVHGGGGDWHSSLSGSWEEERNLDYTLFIARGDEICYTLPDI